MSPPDEPDPPEDAPDDEGLGRDGHVEAAASAWRPHRRDGIGSHPSWDDLDEEGRREAFERAATLRRLEAALDPGGRSTTVKAVLARIHAARRRGLPLGSLRG
jgi:hypothetical protein